MVGVAYLGYRCIFGLLSRVFLLMLVTVPRCCNRGFLGLRGGSRLTLLRKGAGIGIYRIMRTMLLKLLTGYDVLFGYHALVLHIYFCSSNLAL